MNSLINILLVALGLNILIIFLMKREWLINRQTGFIIFAINILLFIIGITFNDKMGDNYKTFIALKIPLLAQAIFIILTQIFRKIYKRNPVDTFWSFTPKPVQDVLFNALFFVFIGLLILFV